MFFTLFQLYMIPMVKIYQRKKTRALYHACVLKYAAAKIRSFLKNGLYFGRPLYLSCQQGKIHHHTRLPPEPISIPQRSCSHLHVDLVGPLWYVGGFNYIFKVIDCISKWMEVIPLSEMSAAACAIALTFSWISRFGVSKMFTSNHGRNLLQIFGFNCAKA